MTSAASGRAWKVAVVCAVVSVSGACKKEPVGATIDRADFIDTYVDLRLGALAKPDHTLTDEDREGILKQHGVTDEDLLHFVDVKGGDPGYMVRLWTEIAGRVPLGSPPPSMGVPDTTVK